MLATLPDTTNCGSDDSYQAIIAAVQATLPSRDVGCGNVKIIYVDGAGTERNCAGADTRTDSIMVEVSWDWDPVSPVGGLIPVDGISGSSTMKLITQPTPVGSDIPAITEP